MPWIINENNEFEYKPYANGPEDSLNEAEKKDFNFIQSYLYKFGDKQKALEKFLDNESLKPITFNIEKEDGSKEEKSLSSEETYSWLSKHRNVFREAGRTSGSHLLAFAIKNGLTMDDLNLLKDHPEDEACEIIRQRFENARKEFFECTGSEDKRPIKGSDLNERESKLVNFFADYLITIGNHLEDIKNSAKTDGEKTMDFQNMYMQYQSLTLQSLALGSSSAPEGTVDWNKLIPAIDSKLKEKGAEYTFDNISDFGSLAQMSVQPSESLKKMLDQKQYENEKEIYRGGAFTSYAMASYIMSYLADNFWHSNVSASEYLKNFKTEKIQEVSLTYGDFPNYSPGAKKYSKVQLQGLANSEDMRTDLYLDHKLSKFVSQTVSANFENELHALAASFGNQSNPMDPGFNEMTKGLRKLSEVYRNPRADAQLKLRALRYAQLKAGEYLDAHPAEVMSNAPKASALLAEKIFTLAGTQKLAVRGKLLPGTLIKGSADYKNHDLSIETIRAMAPARISSEALKSTRYESIALKHINRDDVLPDAQRHLQIETTVDYSKIDVIQDRTKVPVHHGLGKQNRQQGGYNLEFVCAGSSNIQFAKTYKGQTGRNELGKVELRDDPAASEIVDNINQKYNIKFETEKSGDNTKYEFAMEQEYGKPMYLDSDKVLHENADPNTRVMPGIRKLEKGTTTRYNISGAMEKILGLKTGSSNSGDYSIENNEAYMLGLADKWLNDINDEYQRKIQERREFELKPINIMFKGHSRGGVAANEASLMVNYLIEHKYPQLREYVHISTQLLDPVPGFGSNLKHPTVDLNNGDYRFKGNNLRGLKASEKERQNNSATVFYGIHSNNEIGFAPQSVIGTDRLILSCMSHDTGVFDAVDGHKRGYLAENGEEYRGSGLNELPRGLYFVDENKNIISCKNSQEAHKAIDAMLGKHAAHSKQWSRHGKVHDMVDAWFRTNPEKITEKDTRYPVEQAMQEDKAALKLVLDSVDNPSPENQLTAKPDEILTRAVSSLLAHQMLLDKMKKSGERVYPATTAEAKKMLAESEKSGLADKIRKSEDFKLFYKGLKKEDIKSLASADSLQLKSYLDRYNATVNLPAEAKRPPEKDPKEVLKSFLKEKISEATGMAIDEQGFEDTLDYFVTYGDDSNRNRMFEHDDKVDRISQIKAVLDGGGKVFVTLPDNRYHTMDTSELVIKNGKPALEMPKPEYDAMTLSVHETCKRVNALGDMKNAGAEFGQFRKALNDIVKNGIPKEPKEYYSKLNDLAYKAYGYAVQEIDQKMDAAKDAGVTAASQIIEIYRAVCMHEKASRDNMNKTMIASKYLKSKLVSDIKSGSPEKAEKAFGILGDYDKYTGMVGELVESKLIKNMCKGMNSKELEKFAHKNASDITKAITEKQKEQDVQSLKK